MNVGTRTSHGRRRRLVAAGVIAAALAGGWTATAAAFALSPLGLLHQGARVAAASMLAAVYDEDLRDLDRLLERYRRGESPLYDDAAGASWRALEQRITGFRAVSAPDDPLPDVPFVYQGADAAYLKTFRDTHRLDDIVAGAADEYEAQRRLGAWIGTRWDHGTDLMPGDSRACDPVAVIRAGQAGRRFWCEVAARMVVHAASALGWPARLITGSRDGYAWEHAVAEVWSNQFGKWYVVDADFNLVYERFGVPVSAFELTRDGEQWHRAGELVVRPIAPEKPSLRRVDLVPFYAYVHVDLRTDWCTRPLRRGSPAGGERATWWTARPALHRVLTAKTRVDEAARFNWPVNVTALHAIAATPSEGGQVQLALGLAGYSPVFDRFEISVDGGPWRPADRSRVTVVVGPGRHQVDARIVSTTGSAGPSSRVSFEWAPRASE